MKIIGKIGQAGSALWILNVWFNRFNKDTGYRGGNATNMREEFEEYGLPEPVMSTPVPSWLLLWLETRATSKPWAFPTQHRWSASSTPLRTASDDACTICRGAS